MTGHTARHFIILLLRRGTQVAALALVVAISYLGLYAHYRSANAVEDIGLLSGRSEVVFKVIDKAVGFQKDPQEFLDGFKGTLWSMRLAGIDISDPLAGAELFATAGTVPPAMLLSLVIPLAATLLLGRIFCSWICPVNLLLEITDKLRGLLRFAEIRPAAVAFSLKNKYIVLAVGLAAAAVLSRPLFALFYPPAVLSRLIHAWIFGTALTGMLVMMLGLVAVELFFSPRWWCRTMCPGGALYALAGWPRLLRVRLSDRHCTKCRKCEGFCDFGLNPARDSDGIECTNCGDCVRKCPEKALYYTPGMPPRKKTPGLPKYTLSRVTIILATSAVLLAAAAPSADGHHILGLPHYSYKENYPQAPTLEYPAVAGPYDILLTSYPGKPVPKETASLSFYLKNKSTGDPYNKPINVRVLQTFTFGRSLEILKPTVIEPFEQPHKVNVTFPTDGEYVVELTIQVEGKPEVIPFILTAGDPSATASVLIALGVLLVLFIITVRAVKIKRARRLVSAAETD